MKLHRVYLDKIFNHKSMPTNLEKQFLKRQNGKIFLKIITYIRY
uniref:Uncharacterized protein n=1 Tax=Caloglossa intermedia TaxID=100879 RepID=A0A1Z1M703_9FLOR|nr:hypothetical protein [Caloglossa intermedia]ARW61534.1 hypothetical protein [Caloglossa intermedia]